MHSPSIPRIHWQVFNQKYPQFVAINIATFISNPLNEFKLVFKFFIDFLRGR